MSEKSRYFCFIFKRIFSSFYFFRNKRIVGPALPSCFIRESNEREDKNANAPEEIVPEKPKRIFGPSRPPAVSTTERRSRSKSPPPSNDKGHNARESWMIEMGNTDNSLKIGM